MFHVRRSDEIEYHRGLRKVFQQMIQEIRDGKVNPTQLDKRVWKFMHSDPVSRFIDNLIAKMARRIRVNTATSWRAAASKGSRGPEILSLVKNEMKGPVGERVWQLVSENSAFIKTLPQEWALYATQYAAREAMKGKRPEEVEAELRKIIPQHIQKNLKTIARTECAKANAAIVQARAEMCGIRAYIWRSMADERTRTGHLMMDGVLVFYDDPPSPEEMAGQKSYGHYHAGNTFNCRCYQEPVVDASFLPDIFDVYSGGSIKSMTKKELKRKFGKIA